MIAGARRYAVRRDSGEAGAERRRALQLIEDEDFGSGRAFEQAGQELPIDRVFRAHRLLEPPEESRAREGNRDASKLLGALFVEPPAEVDQVFEGGRS